IDVWRRIIVGESCTLAELHRIIQTVFGWRDSQEFRFVAEKMPGEITRSGNILSFPGGINLDTQIKTLQDRNIIELLYEYGTKWTVRIMILSRYETPGGKPVRCVAGAGSAPPEFIGGPLKFKRVISALESGDDMERLEARQELGTEFIPDGFDLDACNRSLSRTLLTKGRGPDR
ncbi:MAG: plasmid pRiA4b ORF-3 family protein, partial [Treponema sp.]|nr:plasmid pRiA4b ORF-3 family protein [Treponema sp.]